MLELVQDDNLWCGCIFKTLHETTEQVFNVVSPEKVTQSAFAQTAAQILKRKPLLSLPAFVLKLLLGEQSQLVLNGQFVRPQALSNQGFEFKYPTLKEALLHLIQPKA